MMSLSVYDTGIRPAIDAYLEKKSKEVRDYGKYWSASSAGYCMRKNIFERLGVPHVEKDSDARTTRIFESGHIFHEWIQRITKDAGLSIAQELELLDEDLHIKGHFDDLVLVQADVRPSLAEPQEWVKAPHLILYDYKTAQSKWFEYAKGRPMSYYNKMQLGTYMYMLRNKKELPHISTVDTEPSSTELLHKFVTTHSKIDVSTLAEARILKISKDDLRLHEIVLNWSADLEKEIVGYWRTLNGYWEKKTIPKCTCADYEINSKTGKGFMADPKYNPYYFQNSPCSLKWYEVQKEQGNVKS